ncbi:MAG: hypothetical protein J2P17_34330, partial [Mycobacterium sp.]|nr:hypothetical protein [Mycobacterium sp.]
PNASRARRDQPPDIIVRCGLPGAQSQRCGEYQLAAVEPLGRVWQLARVYPGELPGQVGAAGRPHIQT